MISEAAFTSIERSFRLESQEKIFQFNNSNDDFLPIQTDFIVARDRAYSWDVSFEEGIHGDAAQAFYGSEMHSLYLKGNSIVIKEESNTFEDMKKRKNDNVEEPRKSLIRDPNQRDIDFSLADIFPIESDGFDAVLSDRSIPKLSTAKNKFPLASEGLEKTKVHQLDIKNYDDNVSIDSKFRVTCEQPSFSLSTTERRLGVYTKEERRQRIDRFRQKKMNRIWKKQIKYDCRKRLADTRPRIKGRFVSRGSPDHTESQSQDDKASNGIKAEINHSQIFPFSVDIHMSGDMNSRRAIVGNTTHQISFMDISSTR